MIPGTSGHPAQTSPRGLSLAARLAAPASRARSGSAAWSGCSSSGGRCPPAIRVAGAGGRACPASRTSRSARSLVLLTTGIVATVLHMPILAALWQTSYGQVILVKSGLLAAAMALGAVNMLRNTPRLVAARDRPEAGRPAATLLRRAISGEAALAGRRGLRGRPSLEPGAARRTRSPRRARRSRASGRARSPRPCTARAIPCRSWSARTRRLHRTRSH